MLIDKEKSCLIISCMQREFIPTLIEGQKLIDNCCWLIDLASHFDIPVIIANHKNLGQPLEGFLKLSNKITTTETMEFSCLEDTTIRGVIEDLGRTQVLLAGAESHISILHSAFSFKKKKLEAFVVGDTISSRQKIDHELAINRLNQLNIPVVTREMIFFEYLRKSSYPNYMDMSLKFLDQRYIRD